MMGVKVTAKEIWGEYLQGVSYNNGNVNLYENVKKNENFFIGNQWDGVNAPDLDKPVFNFLKRVVNLFVSMIVSDDVAASVEPFGMVYDAETSKKMKIVGNEIDRTIEYAKMKAKNRDILRDACVDGDGCFYVRFNPHARTGQVRRGMIEVEVLSNTNVLFGNPTINDVQRQPFIILVQRVSVDAVKREAASHGIPKANIDNIRADSDCNEINPDNYGDKVTVLIKMWKENGTVRFCRVCENEIIQPVTDSGYKLYPVSWISWEKVKNSYHGQAAVTGLIPNQIFVNKCYAMAMDYVKKTAFPKLVYDAQKLPNGFSNRIGEAIGVLGDPNTAIASAFKMPDMSASVMGLVERTLLDTKELMGASDASLGNVAPNNTSAIIAVQKATAAPFELQKMSFYQFVEDTIRIIVDIIRVDYGLRQVVTTDQKGEGCLELFDFSVLDDYELNLNVKVGASSYFSEMSLVQTADNLFAKGIIADPILYVESIPDAYVPNKAKILDALKMVKTKND